MHIRRGRVPLAEPVYCSVSGNFPIVWTNETGESGVEAIPDCGGVDVSGFAILPPPIILKVGRVSSETIEVPDSRCAVWRQYLRPTRRSGA